MTTYSKFDQDKKDILNIYINRRWEQLYGLEKEWGERTLKFLFLTNSGGAIATLSFIGAAKEPACDATKYVTISKKTSHLKFKYRLLIFSGGTKDLSRLC